ncbi:RNA polymerase sigma-70 factor, ECF subfamily [Paenibacillus sophorae]|uniref:RNA polymerase sigma factor SigY n=1 Tax=Paenibacillus sophorae TaxID=1333845 RepID=A0A1H8SMN2_9BACL|nr:RNA polymerase sigma factor SigY [Paenibacillus sophorae]QWU15482.1 RNA polymerase sigma factor SigY [Paenibacillus sophorae]SEO79766.1 RNA polymerase sigma-70 factor, ECF subfamily [Paenibacillus sophorae]
MSDEESQIIRKAQRGDRLALAQLLQHHYAFIYKYLLKLTMDPALAEDVTQDTIVRCMEKIALYNGSSSFSSWMITIATRLYIDRMRRRNREEEWIRREQGIRSIRWRFEAQGEEWSDVLDALSRVPLPQRIALLLKHYYGYSYGEIGRILGIPEGTAKSRAAYGLRQLREELKEDDEG